VKRKLALAATVGALAIALILVLAACGGGGDSEGVASLPDTTGETTTEGDGGSTEPSGQDPQEAALEFARCMREHGVDVPDPTPGGGITLNAQPGTSMEKIQKAQEACGDILQNAGPQLTEEQQSAMQDALLDFAKCMREHGVDFPDPQFGEGGIVTQQNSAGEGDSGGPNPDDPEFQEAEEACEPALQEALREAGLPGGDGGGPELQRSGAGS
jgi:hypothetical protein